MNLQNIFDSTDFVHASGTKEELAVAEFLKGQCESLGVSATLFPWPEQRTRSYFVIPRESAFSLIRI